MIYYLRLSCFTRGGIIPSCLLRDQVVSRKPHHYYSAISPITPIYNFGSASKVNVDI